MVIKVGINGFGRIGRVIFRTCLQNPDIELSAINDPAIDIDYICYLIKFDSTHGKFKGTITHTENEIKIDDRPIKVFRDKLPHTVPWQVAGVQYVVEASGMFTCLEKSSGHLASDGVKRVIVTAPSVDVPMIILGVNDNTLSTEQKVLSCASSTLYCLAPIVKVLEDHYGVTEGFITSIHAMTPSLKPLDGLCLRGKHWRDHRSILQNIIPATTGSCKALAKIIPQVKDKMSGLAFRVPIVNVSVLDMTVKLNTNTSLQEIINTVDKASRTFLQNIIKISNEEAVSSDFIGDSHSCILDADSSLQLKPDFYKIICWYENEYSYACRVLDAILFSEMQFNKPVRLPCKMTYVRAKVMKKQDEVQQTEQNTKETLSIECNTEVPKSVSAQDATLKRKPLVRSVVLKKPLSSHSSGSPVTTPALNRDTKKRNELFKIWNDNNDAQKNAAREKRSSFFHSCMSFKEPENTDCFKTQEHLENVKREFSKMVNITEDLLKKSKAKKSELGIATKSALEGAKFAANRGPESRIIINGKLNSPSPNNSMFGVCSDYKNRLSVSRPVDWSNEEVRCCSSSGQNEKNSKIVNNITSAVKKSFGNNKPCLIPSPEKITRFANQTLVQNNSPVKANDSLKKISQILNMSMSETERDTKTKTDNYFKDSSFNGSNVQSKETPPKITDIVNESAENKQMENKITEDSRSPQVPPEKESRNNQKPDPPEEIQQKGFNIYVYKNDNNMRVIDEELQKRNIILVSNEKQNNCEAFGKSCNVDSEKLIGEIDKPDKNVNKHILECLNRRVPGPLIIVPEETSKCCSPGTDTTISNGNGVRIERDLYDKLDSASATDSTNSFEINERKSQIIQMCDLTSSLEDLARLDKICRIIEISDELSDQLFSSLDQPELKGLQQRKWSFRDLCERIQLDDFCNKVFGKTRS